jgi:hypothetical protein
MTTRKVHIMRLAPDDIRTSKVRARSIRTNDPNLRLVYYELLFALHSAGGVLPSDPAALADELCLEPAVIAKALDELDELSRIPGTRGGIQRENGHIWNQRISDDLERELAFRDTQADFGRKGASTAGKGRPKPSTTPNDHRATPKVPQRSDRGMPNPPVPVPTPVPEKLSLSSLRSESVEAIAPTPALDARKAKEAEKRAEIDWRVEQVWKAHLTQRKAFFEGETGKDIGNQPVLTAEIRKSIVEGLKEHDASFLGPEDRDEWKRRSSVRAAGIGLFLSAWHNASDERNDYRSGGTRYLEPWRPWKRQRGKPDPIPTFAALYFEEKGGSL